MSGWQRGEATIEQMLADGGLQSVTGAAADGQPWLAKARRALATASAAADSDPDSAWTPAYDAARFACTALLTHQGYGPPPVAGISPSRSPSVNSSLGPSNASAGCAGSATRSHALSSSRRH